MLRENLGRIPIVIAISALCAMLLSSSFEMQINQGAWAGTFPGENGLIAFTRQGDTAGGDPNFEIYVINADGSEETRLTNNAASVDDSDPSWSPDGTKIAFVSSRDGDPEIYVMNANGSNPTRLTNSPGWDAGPSWSPDGEKIAFYSDRNDNRDIYVMNADDGSEQTRLTNNDASDVDADPSWSPDGTKIAFSSWRDGNVEEIYVMNADDGSGETRLTNSPEHDGGASWSPDGTKIAFHSSRGSFGISNLDIYVMNAADGSGVKRLTNNDADEFNPSWSPDGTKIAFVSERGRDIYVMNAEDGSEQTNVSSNPANDIHPDWGTSGAPPPPPPEEDTTPPVLTVPEDKVVEAASGEQGAEVTYTVTAQDNVDGNATLEEDGSTVTQDDIGGDIDISCEPASGTTFPIGETTVECSATDEAGNTGTASFTVTVNPPSPLTPAQEAIDELISIIQNLDNVPQSVKTDIIALLEEVSNILDDNNPDNDELVCGMLGALIDQVNANEGRDTLTADQANDLRTQAEDIMNQLEC